MLWGFALLSQMIRTTTFETSLVIIFVLWLRNAFTLVVEFSPRLTELLQLITTRMVSRVTTRAIPRNLLSDIHFRQRSSIRRSLL